MFDRKCKDCIVLKRIKNAFVREELKNSELIIQNGKTYDDAIIINANYAQTECQFRYCGTAIPFLTVRSTAK